MIFIIRVIAIIIDSLLMYHNYKKDNLVGVIFWGMLLLTVTSRPK